MRVQFVAGLGPLVRDLPASLAFYRDMLGIPLGQTVLRLLGPEGLLITLSYTPWMHEGQHEEPDPA